MRHLCGWVEKLLFKSHCLEVKSPPSLSPNGEQHDRFSASQLRVCSHYCSYAISYRHTQRRPPLPSPLQWAVRSGSAHIQLLWRSLICDVTRKKIASPWSQEAEPVCLTLMHADKHNDTHIHTLPHPKEPDNVRPTWRSTWFRCILFQLKCRSGMWYFTYTNCKISFAVLFSSFK